MSSRREEKDVAAALKFHVKRERRGDEDVERYRTADIDLAAADVD